MNNYLLLWISKGIITKKAQVIHIIIHFYKKMWIILLKSIDKMNSIAFKGMEPKNISVDMKLKWYVIASYIETTCNFKIELPIRMLFAHNNVAFQYEVYIKEPIGDAPNLVRNTSMVQDYLERTGLDERISKTREAIKKYTKFLR